MEMWYMRILINQWSLIGGCCFTFNQVCVLWLQLILSRQNCARKSVESKKSHEDHKAMEHGLEKRLAILPISSNILKYRINKNMKRSQKDGWILSCNFYVCESRPHQYQRLLMRNGHSLTPMWKIKSSPIARNMPCRYMNHMSLGQFYDILPALQTSFGFTIQCLSSKNVSNVHQHGDPSQRHRCFCWRLFFRLEGCQWKGLKQLRSMCMWIQRVKSEAQVTYLNALTNHSLILKRLCLLYFEVDLQRYHACRSWFWICPKPHPESLAPLVCISGTSSSYDLRRIGSKSSCPPVVSGQ